MLMVNGGIWIRMRMIGLIGIGGGDVDNGGKACSNIHYLVSKVWVKVYTKRQLS